MLTIIALVHQRAQGKLPDARVELYDRCADTLIEEWDKWKGLAPEDRERPYYQLRRRLLERAAYWMHIESQEADGRGGVTPPVHKRALEMKVAEFLVEDKTLNLTEDTARIQAKQFVALATSRTGILVEREQGAVSFIHLTFQEYFAASDLYW
jgi:predicted NACHT family NTPase